MEILKGIFLCMLAPVGILAGLISADPIMHQYSKETRYSAAILVASMLIIAILIMFFLSYVQAKIKDVKKHKYLKWICSVTWLIVGIVPGLGGWGWKYALCASIFPSISFNYLLELGKKLQERKNLNKQKVLDSSRISDEKNYP